MKAQQTNPVRERLENVYAMLGDIINQAEHDRGVMSLPLNDRLSVLRALQGARGSVKGAFGVLAAGDSNSPGGE